MIPAITIALALIFICSCKDRGQAAREATPEVKEAPAGPEADVSDEVFKLVDQMPLFRDDTTYKELTQWLFQNVKYPAEAVAKEIQGRVFVQFIVDEQGNVRDATVIRSVDPLLDQAALEVVSGMPPWSPGIQGGKPVKVYMKVPISFALK